MNASWNCPDRRGWQRAFSLVEMLVVMGIIVLLVALAAPAYHSVARAGGLTRAGQLVADEIALARQEARSRNRFVEMRVIDLPPADAGNGPGAWRGIQLWMADEEGIPRPHNRLIRLPETVVISPAETLSPLLGAAPSRSGTADFGAAKARSWRGFRFRPGGAMDAGIITATNNFLTLVDARDADASAEAPANFHAIRVNPLTGRVTTHRP